MVLARSVLATFALVLAGCSGGSEQPPPPPQQPVAQQPTAPPGQVLVTVAASSTPIGAAVTGGGTPLGVTPLTAQVPIPAPAPGQPAPAFEFTFQLPGYAPATVSASPVNNTITVNATLAPVAGTAVVPNTNANSNAGGTTTPPDPGGGGDRLQLRGSAGGAITDNHTTTSTIRVPRACTVASLSVDLDGNHAYFSDLQVTLRSPGGETYTLQSRASRNPFRNYTVSRAVGTEAQGAWTIAIADQANADTGRFAGSTMNLRCR